MTYDNRMRENDTYTGGRSAYDTVGHYMDKAGQFELLTAEEEVDLAKQIEAGIYATHLLEVDEDVKEYDEDYKEDLESIALEGFEARQHLISANTRLALAKAAKYKYAMHHNQFSDLINNANLGLIEAASTFDYKRGFKFSSYAGTLIDRSIYRESNATERTVKITSRLLGQHASISKTRREYELANGELPTDDYIAQLTGVPVDQIQKTDTYMSTTETTSLDQPISISGDDSALTLADIVSEKPLDQQDNIFDTQLEERDVSKNLDTIIDKHIDPDDATMLRMYLGYYLEDGPMNYREIAAEYDMTRQNVHRIIKKTLAKLSTIPEIESFKVYIKD